MEYGRVSTNISITIFVVSWALTLCQDTGQADRSFAGGDGMLKMNSFTQLSKAKKLLCGYYDGYAAERGLAPLDRCLGWIQRSSKTRWRLCRALCQSIFRTLASTIFGPFIFLMMMRKPSTSSCSSSSGTRLRVS